MRWPAALAAVALLGASCTRTNVRVSSQSDIPSREHMTREVVSITTADDVQISGHWYPAAEPVGWVLLLHMMPATKESYVALAETLQQRGIASLVIDFRGHGESQGGPKGYERFTDAEQQAKIRDVEAAYGWLADHVPSSGNPYDTLNPKLVLVGASIGANLALQFARDNPTIAGSVLLSPGLDYRGIQTAAFARTLLDQQARNTDLPKMSMLLAAGGADDDYSTETIRQLAAILGSRATVRTFASAGHGTTMFDREPKFLTEVVSWIDATVRTR
ncbi:MAG: alpha/beta fold hydrolase [bacterium]|nr:alpha/beta fold hydrolase [bacterium]